MALVIIIGSTVVCKVLVGVNEVGESNLFRVDRRDTPNPCCCVGIVGQMNLETVVEILFVVPYLII